MSLRRAVIAAVAATAAAATLAVAATVGGDDELPVRIYLSVPLQGDDRDLAAPVVRASRFALVEHERAGGRPVQLVVLDDARGPRWSAERVRANASRAARDPRAVAYVGEINSEATAEAMPILNRAGLAHVAPVSSAVALTTPDGLDPRAPGRYRPTATRTFGRVIPNDRDQAAAIVKQLRAEHVARLYVLDDGALYGRGLAAAVSVYAAQQGIRVLERRTINPDAAHYRRLARGVARSGSQAVVFGGPASSHATRLFNDIAAAAPRTLLVGGDALARAAFAARLSPAATRRARLTAPLLRPNPREVAVRHFGTDADPYTWLAYEAAAAVLDAIDRAGEEPTRRGVRRALFAGERAGVFGRWGFDSNGDSTLASYQLMRVHDRRIVPAVALAIPDSADQL